MLIYRPSVFKVVKYHVSCLISTKYRREIWLSLCCFVPPPIPVFKREGISVWCWYFLHRHQTVVTAALFFDCVRDYFVREVEGFIVSVKLKFRDLLINRNALFHTIVIRFAHPNAVCSLPSDTPSLSPPPEQGIVAKFETYCTRFTCRHVLSSVRKTRGRTSYHGGRSSTSLMTSVMSMTHQMW